MANLIISIIAIALAAAVSIMGGMYVRTDVFRVKEYQHETEVGFLKLLNGYHAHIMYKNEKLSIADWKDEIASVSGNRIGSGVPEPVKGFNWWYNKKPGRGYYFCLSGIYNPTALKGFIKIKDTSKYNNINVAGLCGATIDDLSITSDSVAITHWIVRTN